MLLQPRILMISAISVMTLSACSPANTPKTPAAASNTATAATVNGIAISESRVNLLAGQRAAHGQPSSPDLRNQIIEQLSIQLILSDEATKKGLDKKPEVLDQIDLTKQSILAQAYIQDYISSNPISDDMLKAEYEKIKAQLSGSEYKARHILVETEATAKDIIAKLKKNPKAFESLAKEKSLDSGSKANGGDLGWFDPKGMVPEFSAAVAKLEKGKFTDEPVKSQFGYHVILLEDSRQNEAPPLDEIKTELHQQIQSDNVKKLLTDLKAKAKIEITQAAAPAISPEKESKHAESGK